VFWTNRHTGRQNGSCHRLWRRLATSFAKPLAGPPLRDLDVFIVSRKLKLAAWERPFRDGGQLSDYLDGSARFMSLSAKRCEATVVRGVRPAQCQLRQPAAQKRAGRRIAVGSLIWKTGPGSCRPAPVGVCCRPSGPVTESNKPQIGDSP
jgi:hypothetical protein